MTTADTAATVVTQTKARRDSLSKHHPLNTLFAVHNNELQIEWYILLEQAGVDYDLLMATPTTELKQILVEHCKLEASAAQSIIAVLSTHVPESMAHKEANNHSKESETAPRTIIISNEEYDALAAVKTEIMRVDKYLQGLPQSLQENVQQTEQCIRAEFDKLLALLDKQKSALLSDLEQIAEAKQKKLTQQETILKQRIESMKAYEHKALQMIEDEHRNADLEQRKRHILEEAQLLSIENGLDEALCLVTNDKIVVSLDIEPLQNAIRNMGVIYGHGMK